MIQIMFTGTAFQLWQAGGFGLCCQGVLLFNARESRGIWADTIHNQFVVVVFVFFCYLLFIVVVAAAVFSNHQQWVQPSFSPSVLSTPLPFKVSLTLIHSTACSPTIFISTSCSIQTQISLIYQLNDLLCGFICPVPIPHLSVCMFPLLSQALPSHPFHACSPSHADVRWSTPVQQHAAVNCLHCLLPNRPGLWTVHLWYWRAHKYMDPRYKFNVPRFSVM